MAYGTDPHQLAQAEKLAKALEAKWQLLRLTGRVGLVETDVNEIKELLKREQGGTGIDTVGLKNVGAMVVADLTPVSSSDPDRPVRLHAAIHKFVEATRERLKPDRSNVDHVVNTCERITRAVEAQPDIDLDKLRRKEIEGWLLKIRGLTSKSNGRCLSATTVRNLTSVVRTALKKFAIWEWWSAPTLWEEAFGEFTIKKLQTTAERKAGRKRPVTHSVAEKRILWHLSTDFERAVTAFADWAGHTQMEVATLTFDDIIDDPDGFYIDRTRHKTGVPGRWWVPPEAAEYIRKAVARTPRDPVRNPQGLALLMPSGKPLVYRRATGKMSRIDNVGGNLWRHLLAAAGHYGVRPISFKYMRKGMAQLIRDRWGKEISRTFLAHSDEDVQDTNYTRPSYDAVEQAVRALYPQLAGMFVPITLQDWPDAIEAVKSATQPGQKVSLTCPDEAA